MSKRIASYALFGNHVTYGTRQFYWDHLPGLVRAHHNLFPGWELRLHVDATYNEPRSKLLRAYASAGLINVKYVEENKAVCRSMLWRLLPLWDEDVEYVLCRDVDSMPSMKERRAVDQFIQSGAAAHTMHDHPQHTALMMGGLVGFHAPQFKSITQWPTWEHLIALSAILDLPTGGSDQILMSEQVWPLLYPNVCSHRFQGLALDSSLKACFDHVDEINPTDVAPGLYGNTDDLMPFLGCSGYSIPDAKDRFDTYGSPAIAQLAQSAESTL